MFPDTATTEAPAQEAAEGFGKIYPSVQAPRQEEDMEEDEDIPSEFISRRELDRGRLSRDGERLSNHARKEKIFFFLELHCTSKRIEQLC